MAPMILFTRAKKKSMCIVKCLWLISLVNFLEACMYGPSYIVNVPYRTGKIPYRLYNSSLLKDYFEKQGEKKDLDKKVFLIFSGEYKNLLASLTDINYERKEVGFSEHKT